MNAGLFDVLVAGEINPDLILSGNVVPEFGQMEKMVDEATLAVGSSSVIFACGAARLGLRVAFVGVCGDDLFGDYMLGQMKERNIDVSHVLVREGGQTGMSVILNQGEDRAILTHNGLISALRAEDIPDSLIEQTRHLHVASYFIQTELRPELPGLFRKAADRGVTTSLDTNYDPSEEWLGFEELLPLTGVFFPNEREALALAGESDIHRAVQKLGHQAGMLAVKRGSTGAIGFRDNRQVEVDAVPVDVVDTVGAGDSFDAGFVYGFLHAWSLEKSLRLASVCGSLSTRKSGGVDGQPTLEEALEYVS